MTRTRVAAALAALITALLLQATVIGPATLPAPASLPAMLVAAVALVDGPGAGLALGFAAGLTADLGSDHPAGVLALTWLVVGVVCGRSRPGARTPSVRRDAALAAIVCGIAAVISEAAIALAAGDPGGVATALRLGIPATLFDALLGLLVVPLTRWFLRSNALRAPRPVLLIGGER